MWSNFDLMFFKVAGAFLMVLGAIMGAFFPSEDYEKKHWFIGLLLPLFLFMTGAYLLTLE